MDIARLKDLSETVRTYKGKINKMTHAESQLLAWPDRPNATAYQEREGVALLAKTRQILVELGELAEELEAEFGVGTGDPR